MIGRTVIPGERLKLLIQPITTPIQRPREFNIVKIHRTFIFLLYRSLLVESLLSLSKKRSLSRDIFSSSSDESNIF